MTLLGITYLKDKLAQHVLNNPDNRGHWLSVYTDVVETTVTLNNMGCTGDVTANICQETYTNLVLWFEQLKQEWPEHDIDAPENSKFYEVKPINEEVFIGSVTYTVKKTYEIRMPEGTTREYVDDNLAELMANDDITTETDYWESRETFELEEE